MGVREQEGIPRIPVSLIQRLACYVGGQDSELWFAMLSRASRKAETRAADFVF